jgi:hypothetical protein
MLLDRWKELLAMQCLGSVYANPIQLDSPARSAQWELLGYLPQIRTVAAEVRFPGFLMFILIGISVSIRSALNQLKSIPHASCTTAHLLFRIGQHMFLSNPSRNKCTLVVSFFIVPIGVAAPTVASRSSISITLNWLPPSNPNGLIRSYELYRFQSSAILVYNGSGSQFTDTGLTPGVLYSYAVQASTIYGGALSAPVFVSTMDALPTGFSAPSLSNITVSSMAISWSKATNENGNILFYAVSTDGVEVYRGLSRTFTATGLLSYKVTNVTVQVCNSAGCASSWATGKTLASGWS